MESVSIPITAFIQWILSKDNVMIGMNIVNM